MYEELERRVVEVLPKGQVRPPFKDYLEFVLTHDELVELVGHAETNPEWRAQLAGVAGIYLIVASKAGEQYVGSAHGEGGIWGRWVEYAANGHGGNVRLKERIAKDPDYPPPFGIRFCRFSRRA